MNDAHLRAWWAHRQGLDGSLQGASPAAVLLQSGWARSVGGVGPYLSLFARAGISRDAADRAVAALEIHELPAARGCTYVVPAADYECALAVGRQFSDSDFKTAAKLGVTDKEVDRLCQAVVKALAKSALEPDQIRAAVGDAARSLGEAGKKKGISTTLPLALGRLQQIGEIRRVPTNGRLDQQRYAYTLWRPNPLAKSELTQGQAFVELAQRYFRWVGPATLAEFQWFSGLGVKAAGVATESLGLVPAEAGSTRLLLPEDAPAYHKFQSPTKPQYALVSSLDAIQAHRRSLVELVEAGDAKKSVLTEGGTKPLGGLSDLPDHAILDRGRLIGLWEFDPDAGSIVWATFGVKDKALDRVVAETEAYVRDQLGDARSFSLDSPKSRAPKIAALSKGVK